MEFRWVAGLTLWTMLSGPILSQPSQPRAAAVTARPVAGAPAPVPVVTPANTFPQHRR
jgi:hypothetical protein